MAVRKIKRQRRIRTAPSGGGAKRGGAAMGSVGGRVKTRKASALPGRATSMKSGGVKKLAPKKRRRRRVAIT